MVNQTGGDDMRKLKEVEQALREALSCMVAICANMVIAALVLGAAIGAWWGLGTLVVKVIHWVQAI